MSKAAEEHDPSKTKHILGRQGSTECHSEEPQLQVKLAEIRSNYPAIGQLYGEFSEEQIREYLSVTEMDNDDLGLLKRVVDTAKRYFKDPQRFNAARNEILKAS